MPSFQTLIEELWKSRDKDILAKVLYSDHDDLLRMIHRRLPTELRGVIAEDDVLQDVFIAVFRNFDTLQPCDANAFRAWLHSIVRSKSIDAIRWATASKRDRRREVHPARMYKNQESFISLLSGLALDCNTPSGVVATDEAKEALAHSISSLSEDQRTAVTLICIQCLSLEEAAGQMNRTTKSVRSLVYRAKIELKQLMRRSSLWFGSP